MSRIRVVFSIGALHGGGSERQIVNALTHLSRDRFEPFLYLVYRSGPLLPLVPDDVSVVAFEERDGRPPTGIPGGMHARRVDDMARYLREVSADVCCDRTFLMTLVAADAAQKQGVPNVSTIVTNPSTGFAPVAGRFQWFKKRTLRRLYSQSARVLAVSDGAARDAERFYGLEPDTVVTHYNGVDVDGILSQADRPVESPWWNAESVDGRTVVRIVSAGRLNHEKGFHLLIAAVNQLQQESRDTEFRLALLGEGDHRLSLQSQIDAAGLTDQVSLTGFQNNAPAWFQSADVFVLPSLVEGMPNVLLEAMVCGTPVVSSRCPHGPEEILGDNQCGLLCQVDSVDGLTDTIRQVLQDPPSAQRRATAAQERVQSVFAQKKSVDRLEEFLAEAARRNPS